MAKQQGYSGFEKLVALKKILPRYSQNPAFAKMLIHEAKLAARLQHFNVVQVLDLGEVDKQVFIAMEYVRGRDLAALLSNTYRRKERLPVPISLAIATEFLTGLDYAHRLQGDDGEALHLIHRDISPQNVLISYEGEVKVTDFGIARVLAEGEGFELPGNLHGKFGYMSPEQVVGKQLDQRSDIFSGGVVLHEMLTGRRLYRGKDPRATIDLILSAQIDPPSVKNPDVPPQVDQIVMKALRRERDERYLTVGSLLGDLSRVADSLPQRAARRDIAVYMRRQFGVSSGNARPRPGRQNKEPAQIAQVSGFSPTSGTRQPLGELLIASGALSASGLEIALAEQRAKGGRIGEILVEDQSITDEQLTAALAQQTNLPVIDSTTLLNRTIDEALLRRFPRDAAKSMTLVPLEISDDRRTVVLAVADPFDDRATLESKVILGVSEVELQLAAKSAIRDAINQWYGEELPDDAFEEAIIVEDDEVDAGPPVILIADANAAAAEELAERVREEEYEVLVVDDGKAARDVCREHNPMVAFLDASLPGIDGYNILLEIRSRNPDAAVFITSARADDFHQAKALELGADDFIAKPYSIEVATSKIRREIQKRAGGRPRAAAAPNAANGVSGSLEDMTLIDIIQSLELGRKSATVMIRYDDGRVGEIGLLNGEIKAVDGAGREGEQAFFALARSGPGMFRIEYRKPRERENVTRPNTFLILEALRLIDEEDFHGPSGGNGKKRPEASAPPPASEGLTPIFPIDDLLSDDLGPIGGSLDGELDFGLLAETAPAPPPPEPRKTPRVPPPMPLAPEPPPPRALADPPPPTLDIPNQPTAPAPRPQGSLPPNLAPQMRTSSGMQPMPGAVPATPGGPPRSPIFPQEGLHEGPSHSSSMFVWKPAVGSAGGIPSAAPTAVGSPPPGANLTSGLQLPPGATPAPPGPPPRFPPPPPTQSQRASLIEETPLSQPRAYEPSALDTTGIQLEPGPPGATSQLNPMLGTPPPMPRPPSMSPAPRQLPTVDMSRPRPQTGRPNPNMPPRPLQSIPQPASRQRMQFQQPPRQATTSALGRVPLQRVASVVQRPASQFQGAAVERVRGPHIRADDDRPPRASPRPGPVPPHHSQPPDQKQTDIHTPQVPNQHQRPPMPNFASQPPRPNPGPPPPRLPPSSDDEDR